MDQHNFETTIEFFHIPELSYSAETRVTAINAPRLELAFWVQGDVSAGRNRAGHACRNVMNMEAERDFGNGTVQDAALQ